MENIRASHSEIEAFVNCERLHYYRYGEKLEPIYGSVALDQGNLFHNWLEDYYLHVQAINSNRPVFIAPTLEELTPLRVEILNKALMAGEPEVWEYLNNYLAGQFLDQMEILVVEKKFVHDLGEGINISFKVDLIVRDSNGEIWVIDHKTMGRMFQKYDYEIRPQLPLYIGVLQLMGFPVTRGAYSAVKKKPAKADTITEIYVFTEVTVSPERIEKSRQEFIIGAKRLGIRRNAGIEVWESQTLRNPSACQYCIFKSVCISDNTLGINSQTSQDIRTQDFKISTYESSNNDTITVPTE